MAELADAGDLKSLAARRAGSSPAAPTNDFTEADLAGLEPQGRDARASRAEERSDEAHERRAQRGAGVPPPLPFIKLLVNSYACAYDSLVLEAGQQGVSQREHTRIL